MPVTVTLNVRTVAPAGGASLIVTITGTFEAVVPLLATAPQPPINPKESVPCTRPSMAELGVGVPVGAFVAEQARAFLAGRTGLTDEAGSGAVAAELDYVPLGLAAAAAVIARQDRDYGGYLERLRAPQAAEIAEEAEPDQRARVRAVLVSLELVRAAEPADICTGVMEATAVLSAPGVRRELLHAAGQAGVLSRTGRRVAGRLVDTAVAQLVEQSLLTVSIDRQTVIVHRLVARVVREELLRQGRLAEVGRGAALVLESSARSLAGSPDCAAVRAIPQQVTALLENTRHAVPTSAALVKVLLRLRFLALYHLIELGDSVLQAIAVGESLTTDLERLLGPDHPDTLNAQNSLAAVYQSAGKAAEAIPLLERTLVTRQRILGPDHPDTLTSQNNLATTYQDAGRVDEAILLLAQTLAVREGRLGQDHPSTLNSRSNLAAAYHAAGRTAEAVLLLEQTVTGREQVLGADHPDTLRSRNTLSAARRAADRAADPIPPIAGDEQPLAHVKASPATAESRPTADLAGELSPQHGASPPSEVTDDSPPSPVLEPLPADCQAAPGGPDQSPSPDPVHEPLAVPSKEPPAAEATQELDNAVVREPLPEALSPRPDLEPEIPGLESSVRTARHSRRLMRVVGTAAAILILLVAGGVTVAQSGQVFAHHPGSTAKSGPRGHGYTTAVDGTQRAAVWVSQQVSRNVIVACDPLMCSALKAQGVPAGKLLILRTSKTSLLGAEVVVATPTLRSQFGTRLDSQYAPSVMAGFGSGPSRVKVLVVAKDGAAAYRAALRQDVAARKAAGRQLLANRRIAVSGQAAAQLAAGVVDSRLLIMLAALAAGHPIQILAFGGPGPDASPGVPQCSADLSGAGKAAGMTDSSYLRWLTTFIGSQLAPFSGRIAVVQQGNQRVVRVVFGQPSPLGLLANP